MPLNGNNDRRSSISGRSMDEMEVVIASSSRNTQGALSSSSVHPFHQPHTASRYENGDCDNDDGSEAEDENDSVSDNLGRFNTRSVQQQHKKKPSLSPSMMAHFSQVEKVTSSATASKTKSSLGQGYDISTMFQVGPLPTPPISMA
ncbi:hypothetical protein BGZ96_010918 [Linnemannia gamsii]|uniref:Uncharacterized protein n=1 Tax=Linnemannia gamsii TaxID=64522 RepID=A0ABQ7JU37_9FUNG|nr:hypothetical protein BGZ96_010918 [Linnemannia gamsii]